MKKLIHLIILSSIIAFLGMGFQNSSKLNKSQREAYVMNYNGKPYSDSIFKTGVQTIPGRIECEYFDFGGANIAYKDTDLANNGSGGLNKGPGYLNNFRKNEAPDISYTKFHDSIDNSIYDMVQPKIDQLYLGWTEPGEWVRYTVQVKESGYYKIGTMYTSNRGGIIRFYIDDTDTSMLINIQSTKHDKEPIAWRQWHHWNYDDSLTTQYIHKGKRVITLNIVSQGNFNFDYFKFSLIK